MFWASMILLKNCFIFYHFSCKWCIDNEIHPILTQNNHVLKWKAWYFLIYKFHRFILFLVFRWNRNWCNYRFVWSYICKIMLNLKPNEIIQRNKKTKINSIASFFLVLKCFFESFLKQWQFGNNIGDGIHESFLWRIIRCGLDA